MEILEGLTVFILTLISSVLTLNGLSLKKDSEVITASLSNAALMTMLYFR